LSVAGMLKEDPMKPAPIVVIRPTVLLL
jgi:hypothetical protein